MSRLHLGVLAAILLALFAAPAAAAACPQKAAKPVFAPWADPASYVLANEGAFEGANAAWRLAGARVVAGNEPYYLHQANDRRSLALPAGSVATSPRNCVTLAHPTARFMVRSTGSVLGRLTVTAIVDDGDDVLERLPIGVVTGLASGKWRPSLPMPLTGPLLGSLDGGAFVRFEFRVTGLGGAFQIDDLFIDPYMKG